MNTFFRRLVLALLLLVAVPSVVALEQPDSNVPAITGCTPKREAAIADLTQKALACLDAQAATLTADALTAIAQCGLSTATSGIQDIIDLFTGMQLRYRCASALDGGPACSSVVILDAGHSSP